MRIAVVAPSCPLDKAAVPHAAIAAEEAEAELIIHPQCFREDGHFAGSDGERLEALTEMLEDPDVDAVWFARGGYGSNRIAEAAVKGLSEVARSKTVMGYSDGGFLLSALHRHGLDVAHGPMVQDVLREGGQAALERALAWLVNRDEESLEPHLDSGRSTFAFNLEVLVSMLGTPIAPDLRDCELLIEEVDEYQYAVDRALFALMRQRNRPASLRLGRMALKENDRDFGEGVEAMVKRWCEIGNVDYRGRADIGHDADNRVVPFS
ncbi:LD-carboxypeptidase [Sphingomicrobium sediminis]|uniref:LD-carboxypeptidase n=1 Tax=Sphingomicrobium sediminis TaxID=2950949 RepID=A0A9X2J1J1_9SPHN|nr:LD-carboxypeptidase [Sphingomicrobium sediminis]MCM8557318.1 LD-carboxypeptidase [Sphingomicrobium sediminis]